MYGAQQSTQVIIKLLSHFFCRSQYQSIVDNDQKALATDRNTELYVFSWYMQKDWESAEKNQSWC